MRLPRKIPRLYIGLIIFSCFFGYLFSKLYQTYGAQLMEEWSSSDKRSRIPEAKYKLFAQRNELVSKVCQSNPQLINNQELKVEEFFVNELYSFAFCNVFKVGSTSWFYHLAKLEGHEPEDLKRSSFYSKDFNRKFGYPIPKLKRLKKLIKSPNFASFMIVRDPLERILSAFIDKIADLSVIHLDKIRCEMTDNREEGWCKPSFSDFVNYLIQQDSQGAPQNIYWATYQSTCTPCITNFTHILHMESLNKEHSMLQQMIGLPDTISSMKRHTLSLNYEVTLPEYYSQLTNDQIDALVQIYKMDFLCFGYSWDKYYTYLPKAIDDDEQVDKKSKKDGKGRNE